MKEKNNRIVVLGIAVLLVLGIWGTKKYYELADNINGKYFRQMHGVIGIVSQDEYVLNFQLFDFDGEVDFLKNPSFLSFDNTNVLISKVTYTKEDSDKDLGIYTVAMNLKFLEDGVFDVTSLKYNDGENNYCYKLGKITFVCDKGNDCFLLHGVETIITDNKARITFLSNNEKNFKICDLVIPEMEGASFNYMKNEKFVSGTDFLYEIDIDYEGKKGDVFVFQPIFEIEIEGEKQIKKFVPQVMISKSSELSYKEVREYVK